ncbi:MAG: hypothetical protein LBQ76_04315 [Candidatus Fibromonas sp.]|nr:hypothetical protein [Candidatus Fibromonas sp.]
MSARFAVMSAPVQRFPPFHHDIRKICGVSLHMGVAGNAPTVAAVIANRADTQVCPYDFSTLPP